MLHDNITIIITMGSINSKNTIISKEELKTFQKSKYAVYLIMNRIQLLDCINGGLFGNDTFKNDIILQFDSTFSVKCVDNDLCVIISKSFFNVYISSRNVQMITSVEKMTRILDNIKTDKICMYVKFNETSKLHCKSIG